MKILNCIKRCHLNELTMNMLTAKFTLTSRARVYFCKDGFMMSQTEKPHCTYEVLAFDDTNSDTQSVQSAKYYHKNQV